MEPLVLIVTLWAVVFGVLAWLTAARRARSGPLWALFGVLLGPLALALLTVAPPGRCPGCGTAVRGWETACLVCDRPLGTGRPRSALDLFDDDREPDPDPETEPGEPAHLAAGDEAPAHDGRERLRPHDGRAAVTLGHRATFETPVRVRPALPRESPDAAPAAAARVPATPLERNAAAGEDGRTTGTPAEAAAGRGTSRTAKRGGARRRDGRGSATRPGGQGAPEAAPEAAGDDAGRGAAGAAAPMPAGPKPAMPAPSLERETLFPAVFVGGSEPLVIGGRYLLARQGDRFQVLGPLHTTPGDVRVDRGVADLDVSVVSGRILITATSGGRLALAFNAPPDADPRRLEASFANAPPSADPEPAAEGST